MTYESMKNELSCRVIYLPVDRRKIEVTDKRLGFHLCDVIIINLYYYLTFSFTKKEIALD